MSFYSVGGVSPPAAGGADQAGELDPDP
jgi:hypothetical protein